MSTVHANEKTVAGSNVAEKGQDRAGTHALAQVGGAFDEIEHAGQTGRGSKIGRLARVPIEELVYFANKQRATYEAESGSGKKWSRARWFRFFENRFGPPVLENPLAHPEEATPFGVQTELNGTSGTGNGGLPYERQRKELALAEFEQDKAEARRKLRTASWAMMFFLITTDVIGPTNAPYAMSTVGLVGGIMLYLTFGIAALYSSFLILNLYLRLDSDRHPIHSYGELMEVFFGKIGHYGVSIIQVVQIIFIVGSNNIANAQIMTQLTAPHGSLCFIVSIVIWTIIGLINSIPFRSLSKLSYVASANVVINLSVVFISMGFIAHSAPNYYSASQAYGIQGPPYPPIEVHATINSSLANSVNGAMNMVFGWSGLMIFVEFMNEMRNPFEFARSFGLAEGIVGVIYILYGTYVYALQGQYTLPVAFQGVSKYSWQSVGNGLSLWTYTMASVTYLNIAVKVVYWFIFEDLISGPDLMSKMGFVWWVVLQCAMWAISFIIGTAIPQVQTIQGLIGAACLLQFSYSLPPAMQLAFDIHADASKADGVYVPGQGPNRIDSWRSWSRWRRGLFGGRVWFKGINFVYFLAALATCGLGMWGSIETIKETFETAAATSFGCAAPV